MRFSERTYMKNWKESLDQGGHYDALLSGLS